MPNKFQRLAFIGGGNMGSALMSGLLASGKTKARDITVTDVRPETLRSLGQKFGVRVTADNRLAVRRNTVVVLCVKPQQMEFVLKEIRNDVTARHLIISIAAGIQTVFIEKVLGGKIPVIRVMPNTPALERAGALVYASGRYARINHETAAKAILSTVGEVRKARENQMDAVTALSGSGPAYVFFLAECLAEAGSSLKLSPDFAEALARQTIYGAGLMLKRAGEKPAVLRERVTSPGGTTAAALTVLQKRGLKKIIQLALAAAAKRSRQLSRS